MSKHTHAPAHAHKHQRKQQPGYVTIFIRSHIAEAESISARTGIPAEVILAQSALESNWGRTVKGNAYFGIKGKSPSGNSASFSTHEVTLSGNASAKSIRFVPMTATPRLPRITHLSYAEVSGRFRVSRSGKIRRLGCQAGLRYRSGLCEKAEIHHPFPHHTHPWGVIDVIEKPSYFELVVHERHTPACGGTPETGPRLFNVRVRKRDRR